MSTTFTIRYHQGRGFTAKVNDHLYQGHITGDIRDTPEAAEAYALVARHLAEGRFQADDHEREDGAS